MGKILKKIVISPLIFFVFVPLMMSCVSGGVGAVQLGADELGLCFENFAAGETITVRFDIFNENSTVTDLFVQLPEATTQFGTVDINTSTNQIDFVLTDQAGFEAAAAASTTNVGDSFIYNTFSATTNTFLEEITISVILTCETTDPDTGGDTGGGTGGGGG